MHGIAAMLILKNWGLYVLMLFKDCMVVCNNGATQLVEFLDAPLECVAMELS